MGVASTVGSLIRSLAAQPPRELAGVDVIGCRDPKLGRVRDSIWVDVEVDLRERDDLVADDDGEVVPGLVAPANSSSLLREPSEGAASLGREPDEHDRLVGARVGRASSRRTIDVGVRQRRLLEHAVAKHPRGRLLDDAGADSERRPAPELALVPGRADRRLEVIERELLTVTVVTATAGADEKQQPGEDQLHVP